MKKIFILLVFISYLFSQTKFVIGVENIDYYPLYSYKDNKYGGYSRAILDMFAKEKGYTFEYKAFAINRLYKAFLSGKVDFKYPDSKTWATEVKKGENIIYSNPVAHYIDGSMVRKEDLNRKLKDISSLGTVMGFTPFGYLEYINSNQITMTQNPNFANLLKQTIVGRIDLAYGNILVAKYQLKHTLNKENALVFNSKLPHTKDAYHLSTIKYKKIIEELNIFLKNNREKIEAMKKDFDID